MVFPPFIILSLLLAVLLFNACGTRTDVAEGSDQITGPIESATAEPVATHTPDPIHEIFIKGRNPKGKLDLPTVIHAEDMFTNPLTLPEQVVRFIDSIPELNEDCKSSVQAMNECFAVVPVDLDEDDRADFVLFGRGRNGGANVVQFYVLNGSENALKLVLESVTLQLEIKSKKTRGHFGIEAFAASASTAFVTEYAFNGSAYKVRRKSEEKL